ILLSISLPRGSKSETSMNAASEGYASPIWIQMVELTFAWKRISMGGVTRIESQLVASTLGGLAGGFVASFVMNHVQAAILKQKARFDASPAPYAPARHGAQQQKAQDSGDEPATVKAAGIASRILLRRELRPEE